MDWRRRLLAAALLFRILGDKQSLELVTSDAVYRELAVKRLMDSASNRV